MSLEDKIVVLAETIGTDVRELTNGKVDKELGKGLSDTNFTQAEKDKLVGLESSHFKGQYVSLEALQEAFPLATSGDYANVDEGVGFDVIRYVWDTSDSAWLPQLGASTQLTAAQIKEEYESNPDTNAFTDDEKTKLEGIALGATKNRTDSANADKVHTHTTAQVTGLDTALLNKVDKVAGKGLSSTDFTQDEKTKLASVVTGATANRADTLNADKTHTHTTAQINGLDTALASKASSSDTRFTNAREWTGTTISQAEAEAGTATTRRAFTAQRVRQAIVAWFNGISGALGRTILTRTTAAQVRSDIGLGTAATMNVGTGAGTVVAGDDPRLTDSLQTGSLVQSTGSSTTSVMSQKAVTDQLATKANTSTQVIAGTGLSGGGTLASNRAFNVNYGTTAGTATQGNDSRITGAFQKSQVVQSTGSSTTSVMSQKATTEAIANIPSVSKTSAYTVVAADKGKSIDTTSNVTIRVSVFTVGDVIVVTNTSATNSLILAARGVTIRLAGSTKTGTLTLAGYGVATLRMVTSNVWFASGAGLK